MIAQKSSDNHEQRRTPATATDVIHNSDLGNAQRLVAQHGDDIRYCYVWAKWLVWDGCRWRLDETGEIERRAKDTVRAMQRDAVQMADDDARTRALKWTAASQSAARLRAMVSLAQSEPGIPVLPETLDQCPWLYNCPNGTLDLRTGRLLRQDRGDMLTAICPTEYHADATCPTWERFLADVFAGDVETVAFVQRLLGYCLTGQTTEHILPILWGTGANGKTTLLETVFGVIGGDYTVTVPVELLLARQGDRHPTERAVLFGKRLAIAKESDDGARLAESLAKGLTGGDRISTRRCREDFWDFSPTHKLVLATNHKPRICGTDHAIWRRIRLVPFTVTFRWRTAGRQGHQAQAARGGAGDTRLDDARLHRVAAARSRRAGCRYAGDRPVPGRRGRTGPVDRRLLRDGQQ